MITNYNLDILNMIGHYIPFLLTKSIKRHEVRMLYVTNTLLLKKKDKVHSCTSQGKPRPPPPQPWDMWGFITVLAAL